VADNDRITAEWQYNDVNQVVKHVYEKEKVCISYNKYEYPDTMEIESSSGEKTIRKWEYAETNWPAREFIVSDGKWRLSAVYSMVKSDDVVDVTPSVTNLFFSYAGKSLAVIMCPEDSHQVFKIRLDDMTVENVPRFPSIYVVSFKNGSCWHFVRHDDNVTMDQDIEMNDRSMVVAIRNSVSENGNIGKIVRPVFTVNQFGFSVRNRIRYYPVVECEAWRRFSEVTEI